MKLSVIDLGLKVFKWISRKQYFQMSEERLKEEMEFLNSLQEPEDDIERSYNQYLCKMFHMNILFRILLNITAFVLFLPTLVFLRCRTVTKHEGVTDAVYILSENNKNLLSAGLRQRYPRIIFNGGASKMILRSRDVAFSGSILRKKNIAQDCLVSEYHRTIQSFSYHHFFGIFFFIFCSDCIL